MSDGTNTIAALTSNGDLRDPRLGVLGQTAAQEPVAVVCVAALRSGNALQQGRDDGFLGNRGPFPRRPPLAAAMRDGIEFCTPSGPRMP
jgi:hypothetical protein